MVNISQVISFDKMNVGKKGGGKHWTKSEVKKRETAAKKTQRPVKKKLKMPDWLDIDSAKVWKKTIKNMEDFDILDKVDEDVLGAYCNAVARQKDAAQLIMSEGMTEINAQGNLSVSPHVKNEQSYARLILQYSDKLGLNANSRARLAKKMADEDDDPNGDLFD